MKAETQAGKRTVSVVGALHGELQPHVPAASSRSTTSPPSSRDRGIPAGLMDARQARHAEPAIHPLDAGDVRHGRATSRRCPTCRPAPTSTRSPTTQFAALGQGHDREDRPARARLPGRPEGPHAPLLPGLLLSVLHRRRRLDVQVAGGRGRLGGAEGALGGRRARIPPTTTSCRSPCSPARSGSPGTTSRASRRR